MKLYHVTTGQWNGDDLLSLYRQFGDEAYEEYAKKWPEAGELVQYHVHYIHLHGNLEEAIQFAREFGGEILEIDATELDIEIDNLEYPHPMVRDCIPAAHVKRLARI